MESEQQPAYSSPLAEQLWRRHVLTAGVIPKQHSLALTHDHWPSPSERLPLLGEVQRRWRGAAGAVLPPESLVVPLAPNPQGDEPEMTTGPPHPFAVPRHEEGHVSHADDVNRTAPPTARTASLPRLEEPQRELVLLFPARPNSETTPSPVSAVSTAMLSRTEAASGSPPTPTAAPTVVVGAGIRQRALTTRTEPVIQRKVAVPATDPPRTAAPLHATPSPLPLPSRTRGSAFSHAPAVPMEQAVHSSSLPLRPTPPSPQQERTMGGATASVSSRRENPVAQAMPLGPSPSRPATIPRRSYHPGAVAVTAGGARSFRRVMGDAPLPLSPVHARAPRAIGSEPVSLFTKANSLLVPTPTSPTVPATVPTWRNGATSASTRQRPMTNAASGLPPFPMATMSSPSVMRTDGGNQQPQATPTSPPPSTSSDAPRVTPRPPVEAVALPTLTASSPDPQVDVGQLAEHVYTILVQRLTREKQRRGW